MRSLIKFFRAIQIQPQPFYNIICQCIAQCVEPVEQPLLFDTAEAFFESVVNLEGVNPGELLSMLCQKFVSASEEDIMLLYALKIITAIIPHIGANVDTIVGAIAEKICMCMAMGVIDDEVCTYCLRFLMNVADINTGSPIFAAAVPILPRFLREVSEEAMMWAWALLSSIIRRIGPPALGPICGSVIQAAMNICHNQECSNAESLSNVAIVMFDVIRILGASFDHDAAELIYKYMTEVIVTADDVIDVQNIGSCVIAILALFPDIGVPEDGQIAGPVFVSNILPAISQITDQEIASVLTGMLQTYEAACASKM